MLDDPENPEIKQNLQNLQLDLFDATGHFQELLSILAGLLTKEQYAILLESINEN